MVDEKFTVPGEKLGVIEEYLPGYGTYVDNGIIYSTMVGNVILDKLNRRISVNSSVQPLLIPHIGNVVIGQVTSVQEKSVNIRISKIGDRFVSGSFTGVLHISDLSETYVRSMYDAVKVGDAIKARVISLANRTIHLATSDRKLGIIYAFCTNCGSRLILKNDELICPLCKEAEKRLISLDYGKEN